MRAVSSVNSMYRVVRSRVGATCQPVPVVRVAAVIAMAMRSVSSSGCASSAALSVSNMLPASMVGCSAVFSTVYVRVCGFDAFMTYMLASTVRIRIPLVLVVVAVLGCCRCRR